MSRILAGAAGLAIVASAAPASAQYAPSYNNGYNQNGYQNGYNNQMARARVVGITGVERRSNDLRVTGLISSGLYGGAYGNQGYGNQGYGNGYPNQGYPNQGYNPNYANNAQRADLSFSCRVDPRGLVSDVRINRTGRRG